MTPTDDPTEPTRQVNARRATSDAAEAATRAKTDTDRFDRRTLYDRTRQHGRGDRQAHEALERERQADDESLSAERARARRLRRGERAFADGVAARASASAEEALETSEREASDRDGALRRALRRAAAELQVVRALVDGARDGTAAVPAIDSAVDHIRRALAVAVEGPTRDLGGSE